MRRLEIDEPLPPAGRTRYSNIFALYGARLRSRWPQEIFAVLGIAVGVALLFASQVASTSLSGPVKELNRGIVGSSQLQLVSRSTTGFPERLTDEARAIPGVRIAAPILQVQATVTGASGSESVTVFGADPRVVRLRGALLQGFSGSDAARQRVLIVPSPVAEAIGARFGDMARLQTGARSVAVPVAAADSKLISGLADTAIALAPLRYLQGITGLRGRATRVLVQAEPARIDAVRDALKRLAGDRFDVRAASYETDLFSVAAAPTNQATTISSAVSALVGFLFAFCAMLVTVASRRALAVGLRLDGFRPWQIVRVLMVDALVLGTVAVAAGLVGGELLSRTGYGSNVNFLAGAFPLGDQRVVPWSAFAIAAGAGLLAAIFGVLAPLRQDIFAEVPRQLAEPLVPTARRTTAAIRVLGVLLLVLALVVTVAAPGAALVGLFALAGSLVLLLPSLLSAAVAVLESAARRRDRAIAAVELALPALRAPDWRARSLAIATTGAIAVFGAVALQGARVNLQDGLFGVAPGLNDSTDVWVTPSSGALFGTSPIPPSDADRLRALPGVRSVGLYRAGFLDVADRRILVYGPPAEDDHPVPADQILDGDAQRTTQRLRAGGWATVSEALATSLHVGLGERFTLPGPVPTTLRVAAITTNLGWSGGAVFVSATDFARAWDSEAIGAYQVRLQPGTSREHGARLVADALGHSPGLRVETPAQRNVRQKAAIASGLTRLSQVAAMTLVAAVLAMAAAMAALLWQRRPAVARDKLDGRTTPQMWRALAVESAMLIGVGCLVGAAYALLGQVLFSRALQTISGFPVMVGVRGVVAVTSVAWVVGAALLVVAIPGYLVARVPPSLRTGE